MAIIRGRASRLFFFLLVHGHRKYSLCMWGGGGGGGDQENVIEVGGPVGNARAEHEQTYSCSYSMYIKPAAR